MSGDLIGSRISLISKKDIRWEGILVQVDRENASVTLQNVKSWGTEGRVDADEIMPSQQIHPCVNFRGEDIKDLHVHETAEPVAPPPPPPPTTAPSPDPSKPSMSSTPDVAAGGRREQPQPPPPSAEGMQRATSTEEAADADSSTESAAMRDQGRKEGRYKPPHKNPNWKPPPTVHRAPGVQQTKGSSGGAALPGQGNHLLNRRNRGAGSGSATSEEGEFDFEASLAKFDKEKEMAILAGGVSTVSLQEPSENGGITEDAAAPNSISGRTTAGGGNGIYESGDGAQGDNEDAAAGGHQGAGDIFMDVPPVVVKKYDKSSFFDEISCDAIDGRGHLPGGRGGERTRNTETFGATSVALATGSRRYGGRGGGGYSGYLGGGGRRNYNNERGGHDNDYGSRDRSHRSGGGGNRHDASGSWRRG